MTTNAPPAARRRPRWRALALLLVLLFLGFGLAVGSGLMHVRTTELIVRYDIRLADVQLRGGNGGGRAFIPVWRERSADGRFVRYKLVILRVGP